VASSSSFWSSLFADKLALLDSASEASLCESLMESMILTNEAADLGGEVMDDVEVSEDREDDLDGSADLSFGRYCKLERK
jgi:hypothetical protein